VTEFKNFADFKRRVTHMTLLKQGWYKNGQLQEMTTNPLLGVKRPVAKINSVDIMLTTRKPGSDGETVLSHLSLGKASEWSFDGDTVTKDDGYGIMQYKVEARD
jgi:hypothetical protein